MTINSVFLWRFSGKKLTIRRKTAFFSLESIKLTVNWMDRTLKYDQIGGKISENNRTLKYDQIGGNIDKIPVNSLKKEC